MPLSERFPDIRVADLRAINRLVGHLLEVDDLSTLGAELIRGTRSILPADFMLWNVWTLEMDRVLGLESNSEHYCEELNRRSEELGSTIQHHPVIATGHLEMAKLRPQRMSDYQSDATFHENPLYQEVYRHVDSRHQIAYDVIRLEDSRIILSWNRQNRDFTNREMQLLHVIGLQVAALGNRLEEKRHLNNAWSEFAGVLGIPEQAEGIGSSGIIGSRDGFILSELVRGKSRAEIASILGWRRDTLDRYLAALRERLGYENIPQLLHALAALKSDRRTANAGKQAPPPLP